MNIFKRLFNLDDNSEFLRYSKSMKQWQVIIESRLIYTGDRDSCLKYIENMELALKRI